MTTVTWWTEVLSTISLRDLDLIRIETKVLTTGRMLVEVKGDISA